ncbi:MAG: RNA polymerase sigma factor [Planctomycetota bacterium]
MAEPLRPDDYERLRRRAARHSRRIGEADDLLHDALLVATSQSRLDLAGEDAGWFEGVLRRLAMKQARTNVRRRDRESKAVPVERTPTPRPQRRLIRNLPPAARRVAVLALAGMTPDEIKHVCQLSDAAYRQRLTTVRKAWQGQSFEEQEPVAEDELDVGLIRQALLSPVRRRGHHTIGSHDPDGNLFLVTQISSSQINRPREQDG